jgi:hypothetical protein
VTLWLGNSQLHGINQWRPGDETAPALLAPKERSRGRDVVAFSQPNANTQEHLILFTYLARRLPVEWLVLPIVFDDFRESDIRDDIAKALADPEVASALSETPIGRTLLETRGQQMGGDLAALEHTVQQRSETALDRWFSGHSNLWASRRQARGRLLTELYLLRNASFGISATSKRRVIPGRLRLNLSATRAILDAAARDGIRVLVYICPLRNDVEPPYVASEYATFKNTIGALALEEGALFADFEELVPAEIWGATKRARLSDDGAIDFMHFQGPGHRLLADAVDARLADGEGGFR